jgi:NAD(P)H dehydrogenase (quinone)
MPATVFTHPEVGAVGVSQTANDDGSIQARIIMLPVKTNARAKMSELRKGFVKLFCRQDSGVVIGGVVVATIASVLILPIAMAVQNRITVDDLALGIVLTLIYAAGLLFRPRRRVARLGVDSLAVVILYGLGMLGLFTVSNMR